MSNSKDHLQARKCQQIKSLHECDPALPYKTDAKHKTCFFQEKNQQPQIYNFSGLPSCLIDTQVRSFCHVHVASQIKRAGGF